MRSVVAVAPSIVRAVSAMGKSLSIVTTAEGVDQLEPVPHPIDNGSIRAGIVRGTVK
jgi:hypothetical protein